MSRRIRVVCRDKEQARDLLAVAPETTVREALSGGSYELLDPLTPEIAGRRIGDVEIQPVLADGVPADAPRFPAEPAAEQMPRVPWRAGGPAPRRPAAPQAVLTEADATQLAYAEEIAHAGDLLESGQSVLVFAEKLVVPYLWQPIVNASNLSAVVVETSIGGADAAPDAPGGGMLPVTPRQRQLEQLRGVLREAKVDQVVVVPHLDLLAGGPDDALSQESREITELVFQAADRRHTAFDPVLLAFADPSLVVPEVLAARFSVRMEIRGTPKTVRVDGHERPAGEALVTTAEAGRYRDFDAVELHKYVAGMNPVRLRQAIKYAERTHLRTEHPTMADLRTTIRQFKAQSSTAGFEVPKVRFEDIGGYADVKEEIGEALDIFSAADSLTGVDPEVRRELVPHGYIFYGPPGTGKTLFAKAIANRLDATIQVVAGPEVTNMYVGESERKVRELFADARRNAPAVLVFDEFDAIATKRSGREDGGSRAGNAIVAQILTEMDGFRPDESILVIGTTNRLDIIDEALLRPSRFRPIQIDLPDADARRAIVEVHARRYGIDLDGALIELITDATDGRNGDEIRSVFSEALRWQLARGTKPDAHTLGVLVGRLHRAERQRKAYARDVRSRES